MIGAGLDAEATGVFVIGFDAETGAGAAFLVADATGTSFLVAIGVRIGLFTAAGVPVEDTAFLTGVAASVGAGTVFFATGRGFFVPMGVLAGLVGIAEAAAGVAFFKAGLGVAGVFVGGAAFFATVGDAFVWLATLLTPAASCQSFPYTRLTNRVLTLERSILLLEVV